MSTTYGTLYEGQLPNSVTVLATVPANTNWIIKGITVVNNDSVARTFGLYRNGTAAANVFIPPTTSIDPGGSWEFTGSREFEAGATIAGIGEVASQLTIIIDGAAVSSTTSGAANIYVQSVTISEAAWKSLPTTPVELVPAPGAGLRLVFMQADLETNFTAGAYTNVNAGPAWLYINLAWEESASTGSNYVANDGGTTPALTKLSGLLSASHRIVTFVPFTEAVDISQPDDWGNALDTGSAITAASSNAALQLIASNNGSGNWTGGNAANTRRIVVTYQIVAVL